MKQPRVCIAMATYNGAAHMRIQFDSLLKQTYENFVIVIRDDGSTDDTVAIVKEYQDRYPDRFVLLEDDGANLRCPGSFYRILQTCEPADYYGFCDQDDYWKPEKIACAVEALEKLDGEGKLYLGSYDYYTQDHKYIRAFPKQQVPITLARVIYHTPASGFTLMFDEKIRRKYICEVDPGTEMHDRWLIRCAVCFEQVVYDERSLAEHIRFEESVTAEDAGNKKLLTHFIQDELMSDVAVEAKKDLCYFEKVFGGQLTPQDAKLIHTFTKTHGWAKKLLFPHRMRARIPGEIALRILFLIGKI